MSKERFKKKLLVRFLGVFALCSLLIAFSSCSREGYGVLLWPSENPPIQPGTVLRVYIRSNIEQLWVVGIPRELITDRNDPIRTEIPLAQLELVGSRRRAQARAQEFAPYASLFAENLQDRLPIRERPDNVSRRVYTMRLGEIIKILARVDGRLPIGTDGEPLEGSWYRVLTNSGTVGYCFSLRLRIFNKYEEPLGGIAHAREVEADPELDMIFSRTWSPEFYAQMINSRRIDLHQLERRFRFDPGQYTGRARIVLPDLDREFVYQSIIREGERTWRFEGTSLQMNLRLNNTLAVQFDDSGSRRSFIFTALVSNIDDLIIQESARREAQFREIFNAGPVFTSSNFGTITFTQTGEFTWTGFDLLVPQLIPANTLGEGRVLMDLFITQSHADRFDGAFSMRFSDRRNTTLRFLYSFDNQGLRLEFLPAYAVEEVTVTRRSSSPMVLFFFKDTPL